MPNLVQIGDHAPEPIHNPSFIGYCLLAGGLEWTSSNFAGHYHAAGGLRDNGWASLEILSLGHGWLDDGTREPAPVWNPGFIGYALVCGGYEWDPRTISWFADGWAVQNTWVRIEVDDALAG